MKAHKSGIGSKLASADDAILRDVMDMEKNSAAFDTEMSNAVEEVVAPCDEVLVLHHLCMVVGLTSR